MLKKYRILIYLHKNMNAWVEEGNLVFAKHSITQEGIAMGVGVGRNNIAREIKKLKEEGLIKQKKARIIDGKKRRVWAYTLTMAGEMKAMELEGLIDNRGTEKV